MKRSNKTKMKATLKMDQLAELLNCQKMQIKYFTNLCEILSNNTFTYPWPNMNFNRF